jgi:hypothetical protein
MNDDLRPRACNRVCNLIGIERIGHDRLCAKLVQERSLGLAARHPKDLVASCHQAG